MTKTSERLRNLRKELGYSQLDMANKLRITRTAYNKYEQGVIYPVRKVKRLAEIFNTSTDYILGYSNTRNPHYENNEIIEKYYKLSIKDQNLVNNVIERLYENK